MLYAIFQYIRFSLSTNLSRLVRRNSIILLERFNVYYDLVLSQSLDLIEIASSRYNVIVLEAEQY
jgi:hypothetical protein